MTITRRQFVQHQVFLPIALLGPDFQFAAHRDGTVQELTSEFTGVQNSKTYGTGYLVGIRCLLENKTNGWIYLINGTMRGQASQEWVAKNTLIEWRYVEITAQTTSPE